MKKEIRDYLHLYPNCNGFATILYESEMKSINCEMVAFLQSSILKTPLVEVQCYDINGKQWETTTIVGIDRFKPILRPLSDMTEDEEKETSWLYFNLKEGQEPGPGTDITTYAGMVKWYLSKHFDLFGLIETGLAIDASTLTTPDK